MKGSVACMLAAASQLSETELSRPVYITCTADEEVGYGGAREVATRSKIYGEMVAGESRGIIGEPTRLNVVHGHKGTYGVVATSRGRAAHSSTREGLNANLAMIPYLSEIKELFEETENEARWQNTEFDPPTVSWNIGINDHTAAINITPPQSVCTVYFRPMPGIDPDELALDEARYRRSQRRLLGETAFIATTAEAYFALGQRADLIVCVGAQHAFGSFEKMLDTIAPYGGEHHFQPTSKAIRHAMFYQTRLRDPEKLLR